MKSKDATYRLSCNCLCLLFTWQACRVSSGWIDPDTPLEYHTIRSLVMDENDNTLLNTDSNTSITYANADLANSSGKTFHLVMSDEFNVPGRSFSDGHDPKWTALDKNDYTNDALHYYSSNNVRTNTNGELEIKTLAGDVNYIGYDDATQQRVAAAKHFTSGMVQSWNKFCFTGGIVEAEVVLPGTHNVSGLWPAFWLLGNLARHTYVGTSANVWPFTSHGCTQTTRTKQRINGCDRAVHYDLESKFGRGAPEIDIFEIQAGDKLANTGPFLKSYVGQPFMSCSYQLAPGRPVWRPSEGDWPGPDQWYEGMQYGNETCLNINFYGTYLFYGNKQHPEKNYWSDALSYNRQLHERHFSRKHTYRLEWGLPKKASGIDQNANNQTSYLFENRTGFESGHLNWFLDGQLVMSLNGSSLESAHLGAEISTEPMAIIMNTAISKQWGFPLKVENCPMKIYDCNSQKQSDKCGFSHGFCAMMQTKPSMTVNYIRVYQDPSDDDQIVGCSTPERPTRTYIEGKKSLYTSVDNFHPLRNIQQGGGQCDFEEDHLSMACGGARRGKCTRSKQCFCNDEWTGPHCLAPNGNDDIVYDKPDTVQDLGFSLPVILLSKFLFAGMICVTVILVIGMAVHIPSRRKLRASIAKNRKEVFPLLEGEA